MGGADGFQLTRLLFQRSLGLVYLVAFVSALNQFRPLLGERGLLPAPDFMKAVAFFDSPSLFYFFPKDAAFSAAAWLGIALSCLAVSGVADGGSQALSFGVWAGLWVLYLSFVNVGQIFYAFGWESLLLEAGFYAMFLGPLGTAAPRAVIWMLRWLMFRVMLGAGLIKLRGDPCWRDMTCLDYHFETQPMPNGLSWYFHWAPVWTRRLGVGFNHFAEVIAPFGLFLPSRFCAAAGAVMIVFQLTIMASGNLSWLNFLTIVLAIPAFDDRFLASVLPLAAPVPSPQAPAMAVSIWAVAVMVAVLSLKPVRNMLSPHQAMNVSYNPLHLVGTYGAFGSVTRKRYEIVVSGTDEASPSASTRWREYEFKGKPGDPLRRPPQIAPYHLRLGWLMWFAAMSPEYEAYQHPWFARLIERLLEGDRGALGLLEYNPFPLRPPRFIRAELYEYRFATPTERRATGAWWVRTRAGAYFPEASL
jgi:hypothetical protein